MVRPAKGMIRVRVLLLSWILCCGANAVFADNLVTAVHEQKVADDYVLLTLDFDWPLNFTEPFTHVEGNIYQAKARSEK